MGVKEKPKSPLPRARARSPCTRKTNSRGFSPGCQQPHGHPQTSELGAAMLLGGQDTGVAATSTPPNLRCSAPCSQLRSWKTLERPQPCSKGRGRMLEQLQSCPSRISPRSGAGDSGSACRARALLPAIHPDPSPPDAPLSSFGCRFIVSCGANTEFLWVPRTACNLSAWECLHLGP